jgi:hypothetical protein
MTPLYLINACAYLGAALVILFAIHKLARVYRWLFVIPFLTCVYYGGVYLAVITGFLCEQEIATYTRPFSAVLPIQLAVIILFVVRLMKGVPDGRK